ncbi:hypothetical protein I302_105310 [Kwoniella bestiolae CBS 10118]|uniref:Uncharacterized protein n=1 Tax=Kwoniella bestiolae CBS 10118 TaxID=1296100 RepID=A0AAJ8M9H5_9TREE
MYPQFTTFHPYGYLPRPSQATLVEPTSPKPFPRLTNSGQTPSLHWRNYHIIGLDRNSAPAFFTQLDKNIHIALTRRRSFFSSP